MSDLCIWTPDDEGAYDTACGNAHIFVDGTPTDNKYTYCPYCGYHIRAATPPQDQQEGASNG